MPSASQKKVHPFFFACAVLDKTKNIAANRKQKNTFGHQHAHMEKTINFVLEKCQERLWNSLWIVCCRRPCSYLYLERFIYVCIFDSLSC